MHGATTHLIINTERAEKLAGTPGQTERPIVRHMVSNAWYQTVSASACDVILSPSHVTTLKQPEVHQTNRMRNYLYAARQNK